MAQEIRVMKPQDGWPISRTNANSAAIVEVKTAPGAGLSHYLTGCILTGGATADGFTLLRRACIKFAAANNTVTVSDAAGLEPGTADFGIVFGIKMTAAQVTLTNVIDKYDASADGYKVDVDSAGKAVFTMGDAAHTATVTTLNPINDGYWHQIVVTCDRDSATGLKIYVDGSLSNTADPSAAQAGVTGGSDNLVFNGTASKTFYLSTFALYVTTLPVAATLWASGAGCKFVGDESGVVVSYNFEENTGSTCVDLTGALDGTLANGTWTDGDGFPIDSHTLKQIGPITSSVLVTTGGFSGLAMTFPHAIKVGRNNPIRLSETNGSWNAILFGYTDGG